MAEPTGQHYTDVLIAGAGPAGLMLACELALRGVRCTVLDRQPHRPAASGGMLLPARTAQLLALRGLADRLGVPGAPPWPRTHFAFLYLDTAEHSPDSVELIVPQWQTVEMLAGRAVELGVTLIAGARLAGLDQHEDQVTGHWVEAARTTGFQARYLIGCDGSHSEVARLAGFEFEVLAGPYYGLIGDFPADPAHDRFRAGNFAGGQFGVLPVNPADPGEIRLMTVEHGRHGPDPDVEPTVTELAEAIARITGTPVELGRPNWLLRYGSQTRYATELRRGRVLLAGDAAHAHPPSAGNGLNTAIQDAMNLGWKLAWQLSGQAGPALLDSYTVERLPVARRVCTRAAAQLPVMQPAEVAAPLRAVLAELLAEVPGLARSLIEYSTEIRYSFSTDRQPVEAPVAELIGSQVPLALADRLRLPDGRGALLRLHSDQPPTGTDQPPTGTDQPSTGTDQSTAGIDPDLIALRPWQDRIAVLDLPAAGWPAGHYLIRPDGYLAWAEFDQPAGYQPATDRRPISERAGQELIRWFGAPVGVADSGPKPAIQRN